MNAGPLVSVIVPVYNVEGYVSKCIESLLGQTDAIGSLRRCGSSSPKSWGIIIRGNERRGTDRRPQKTPKGEKKHGL